MWDLQFSATKSIRLFMCSYVWCKHQFFYGCNVFAYHHYIHPGIGLKILPCLGNCWQLSAGLFATRNTQVGGVRYNFYRYFTVLTHSALHILIICHEWSSLCIVDVKKNWICYNTVIDYCIIQWHDTFYHKKSYHKILSERSFGRCALWDRCPTPQWRLQCNVFLH